MIMLINLTRLASVFIGWMLLWMLKMLVKDLHPPFLHVQFFHVLFNIVTDLISALLRSLIKFVHALKEDNSRNATEAWHCVGYEDVPFKKALVQILDEVYDKRSSFVLGESMESMNGVKGYIQFVGKYCCD